MFSSNEIDAPRLAAVVLPAGWGIALVLVAIARRRGSAPPVPAPSRFRAWTTAAALCVAGVTPIAALLAL